MGAQLKLQEQLAAKAKQLTKLGLIIATSMQLVSCSTYPNKFNCSDARGVGCTMLAEIDQQITSGKIKEAYLSKQEQQCSGNNCSKQSKNKKRQVNIPELALPELSLAEFSRIYQSRSNN